MTLQRDAFIGAIHEIARHNRDVVFLSADFGAESLDAYREELPDQFMHCGISEQHMIDMAAGLALAGKKVYTYCMGPFHALRCYEQIKCSIAMMDLPVTMIGAGVGLGYADAGPTHYVTEDIACLRALNGIEVWTPADAESAKMIAWMSFDNPKFRYVRLDRELLPVVYGDSGRTIFRENMQQGFVHLAEGRGVCILSSGYMLHRVLAAVDNLRGEGTDPGVIDLPRMKPLDADVLAGALDGYDAVVTVEEQCLSGGLGSAVLEALSDQGISKPVHRMGLPERYFFENGGRAKLLDSFGLSVTDICNAVKALGGA